MEHNFDLSTAQKQQVSFRYIYTTDPSTFSFGLGATHGINQVCPYCKAGSYADGKPDPKTENAIERITDTVVLNQWSAYHPDTVESFGLYACHACGAVFSWVKIKVEETV